MMRISELSPGELLHAVVALQAEHAELIAEDKLELWPDLFTEGALYQVLPRENFDRGMKVATIYCTSRSMLVDRVVSLRRANIFPAHHYRHILSLPQIYNIEGETILARTGYAVLQTRNDGATQIYNAGRYEDRICWDGGRLRFAEKTAVFDTSRIETLMAKPI